MGGAETVILTAREHFICHLLLPKMIDDYTFKRKMYFSLWAMTIPRKGKRHILNSYQYSIARKYHAKYVSEVLKNRPISEVTKKKMSMSAKKRMKNKDQTGKKCNFWTGYYHTPWGIFETYKAASAAAPFTCGEKSVHKWCKSKNNIEWTKKSLHRARIPLEWINKTPREVGFYFESVGG